MLLLLFFKFEFVILEVLIEVLFEEILVEIIFLFKEIFFSFFLL